MAAAYSRQFGLDVRVARPGIVYGPEFIPGDTRPFAVALSQAASGKDLLLPEGMGSVRADVTYVSDCVAGLLAILARGEKGCYNISNNEAEIDLSTALKDIAKEAGVEVKEGSCCAHKCSDGSCCGGSSSCCGVEKVDGKCGKQDSGECSDGSCCTMKKQSCSDGSCCGGSDCCGKEKGECKFPRLTRLNCDKLQKLGWEPKIGPEDGIGFSLKALKK